MNFRTLSFFFSFESERSAGLSGSQRVSTKMDQHMEAKQKVVEAANNSAVNARGFDLAKKELVGVFMPLFIMAMTDLLDC